MRVLIAGGGTGGHLYPGIAVARQLLQRDPATEVRFVGTAAGIEARVLPREGFALDVIRVAGLKGTSLLKLARSVGLLPLSALDAWRVISRFRPDVVVGVGGYASGPVLMLAALRGRPTMVLEQNAQPGLTNRLLAPFVRAAAVNFDEALRFFPRTGFVAGNPVRPEFFAASHAGPQPAVEEAHDRLRTNGAAHGAEAADSNASHRPSATARVLIVGGSQGAHAINVAVVEAAPRLAAAGVPVAIVHQTGQRDLDMVRAAYERNGLEARVEAFIVEIDREMKEADLMVCRSGATTLAEVAAVGRPAVLVPFPGATDDHQLKNAQVFGRAGAAMVIEERQLDGERLAAAVGQLVRDRAVLARMGEAARRLARPDAAERVAERVEQLGGRGAR